MGGAASSWEVCVEADGCACPTASTAHLPAAEMGMLHEGTRGSRDTDSLVSGARGEISAFVAKEKGLRAVHTVCEEKDTSAFDFHSPAEVTTAFCRGHSRQLSPVIKI